MVSCQAEDPSLLLKFILALGLQISTRQYIPEFGRRAQIYIEKKTALRDGWGEAVFQEESRDCMYELASDSTFKITS